MEKKELLTVQELSNLKKKSIQGIYKRIRNPNDVIQNFLKRDSSGNVVEPYLIYANGIDIIYKKDRKDTKETQLNAKPSLVEFRKGEEKKENKEPETAYSKTIEILQEQLNLLQEELRAEREDKQKKDDLIMQLNERLAESQRNLDQQQKLQLMDRKRIQELEEISTKPLHKRLIDFFSRKGAAEQWTKNKKKGLVPS